MAKTLIHENVATLATTDTVLYTCPALTKTVISNITVTNRGGVVTSFRVGISIGGGALANEDYLYFDVTIPRNDAFLRSSGDCLNAGDEVRVYAGNGNLTFSLSGEETT
jgi:hypothetical protein